MVFFKPRIPSRRLNDFKTPSNIQIIAFEINHRKEKWLVASIYKSPSIQIFPLVFNKSIRILLDSVWKSYHFWLSKDRSKKQSKEGFLLGAYILQYHEAEHMI